MQIKKIEALYFWLIPLILYFLWSIKNIVFIVILGIIIGLAFQEWSIILKRKIKTPFIVNLALFYIILITIFITIIFLLGPIIILEIKEAIPNVQEYFQSFKSGFLFKYFSNFFKSSQENIYLGLSSFFKNILGIIGSLILVVVISFYTATQINLIPNLIKVISKEKNEIYINFYLKIKRKFASWLAAELFLMGFVGLLTFGLMKLLKIQYPGLIGVIAGLTEIVPILGPIFSGAFAVFITLTSNPNLIIWVIVGFIIIQQIENHILIPFLAKIIFEVNPLITLIGILVGGNIGGIIGILTVIPLAVIIIEIYKAFYKINKE